MRPRLLKPFRAQVSLDAFERHDSKAFAAEQALKLERREKWESTLDDLSSKTLFFDDELNSLLKGALKYREEWFCSRTAQEGIEQLMHLEHELTSLANSVAERHRRLLANRRDGMDVA